MKHFFILLISLLIRSVVLAGPVNDDPTGAILLPISTSAATCPNTIYTNVGATATADVLVGSGNISPACYQNPAAGFNFTVTRDVWFKFTVPASGTTNFDISLKKTVGSSMTQLALSVYRGNLPPSNLDLIACEMAASLGVSEVVTSISSPVVQNGNTYYIRVDGVGGSGVGSGGDFTICVRPSNPIYYMNATPQVSSLPSGTLYDSGGTFVNAGQIGNYDPADDHVFHINRFGAGCMELIVDSLNINGTGVLRIIDEITGDTIDNIRGNAVGSTAMRFQVASNQLKIEFKGNGVLGTGFKLTWLALPNCTFAPPTSCGAPQIVSLPYAGVNETTCTDELRGVITTPCGKSNAWDGRDRIIAFTSKGAQCIKVAVGGYNLGGMSVGLFKGCPSAAGSTCLAKGATNAVGDTVYIPNARLELPGTYYLVLSRLNGCTQYNLNIDTISCLNILPGAGTCAAALSLNDCSNTVPADVRLGLMVGTPPTNNALPNVAMGCIESYNVAPSNYKMVYFKFKAGANGKFAFRVKPNVASSGKDMDFNVWGPIHTEADICNHIATIAPVRSSWAPSTDFTNLYGTGLADTLYPPNGGAPIVITDTADCAVIPPALTNDGIVRALDVIAGKYYAVFLNDFQGNINTQEGVNLDFRGTSDGVLAPANDPSTPLTVMPTDTVACLGSSIQFKASGGIRYAWSPPNGLDTAVIATPRATFTVADTTYAYQVQIQGTCRQVSRSVNVQVFGLRKPNDETVCLGQRLQWNVGQNYNRPNVNYVWSASTGAAGMSQLDVTNPSAIQFLSNTSGVHTYTVQLVTPACTLTQTFTITVTAGNAPTYAIQHQVPICVGNPISIGPLGVSPTPGTNFNWTVKNDPFVSTLQNPTVNPPTSLRYYVLMTTAACPSGVKDSVDVNVFHNPIVALPAVMGVCDSDKVQLGSTPRQIGASFQWTPSLGLDPANDTLPSPMLFTLAGLKRYTVVATTGGGVCTVTKSIDVTGRPYRLNLSDTMILFCASNDTLRIKPQLKIPSNIRVAWTWQRIGSPSISRDTQPSLLHQPRFATQYTATIDSNGCRKSDTVMVSVDSLPFHTKIVRDTLKTAYCRNEIIILKTVPPYDPIFFPRLTSAWTPSRDQLTRSDLFQMVIKTDTPTLKYYRTIMNGGCKRTDSVEVVVNPEPDLKIMGLDSICIGDEINLTASSPKPIPSIVKTFEWTSATGFTGTKTGAVLKYTPTEVGYQYITLTGKTEAGCNREMKYKVFVYPYPALTKPAVPAVCPDQSFVLNLGRQNNTAYSWTGPNGFTSNLEQPSVVPPVDNATYVVTMDRFGCKKTDSVKVTVARATLTVSPEASVCEGLSTTLTATGTTTVAPSSYSWTPSATLTGANTATPVATPTETTVYSVVYRYGPGCLLPPKTVKINTIPNFKIKIVPPQDTFNLKLIDEGTTVDLSSTVTGTAPGATYSWTENGKEVSTTTSISSKLLAPNNQYVNGQEASGYKLVESSVKSGVGTYQLTVKSTNGCSATKAVAIRMRHARFGYPNAFTPNSDAVNAGFRLIFSGNEVLNPMEQNPRLYKGKVEVVSMTVYSRIGVKVYEETNRTTLNAANYAGWNGNLNNEATKELPSDTYVYVIKTLMPDGSTKVISDEIVLVR
jgi:CHU_C Type IX secretion signal domain